MAAQETPEASATAGNQVAEPEQYEEQPKTTPALPPAPSSLNEAPDFASLEDDLQRPVPVWARATAETPSRLAAPPPDQAANAATEDTRAREAPERTAIPPWMAHRTMAVEGQRPQPEARERRDMPAPSPAGGVPVSTQRPRLGWLWSALLGSMLGGILGLLLSILVFVAINGSLDVSRTRGMADLRAQLGELSTELDAIRTDTSTLQGNVTQLESEVEALSALPSRVEQVEDALRVLDADVEALQEADAELQESLDTLGDTVNGLETEVKVIQEQAKRTVSFFERLRDLLTDTFGEGP